MSSFEDKGTNLESSLEAISSRSFLPTGFNLENIDADLHVHSGFSDGINLYLLTYTAQDLGLSTVSLADHVRQRWDDVDFYNRSAYKIGAGNIDKGNNWLLTDNLDLLESTVLEIRKEFQELEPGSETLEETLERLSRNGTLSESISPQRIEELRRELAPGIVVENSFEQDYESWNEDIIEDFLNEHRPDYVPLSVHYVPLDEWEKAKYFRLDEFDDLSDDALARATRNYLSEYENKIEFSEYVEEELGIPVIHTHLDGILRNENLRPYVEKEDFHRLLDQAEKAGTTMEINGRVMRKLVEEYEESDNYDKKDAEWFPREVARRAEKGDLDFIVSSDGHSAKGMTKSLLMVDRLLDEYDITSPGYKEFVSRNSSSRQNMDDVLQI